MSGLILFIVIIFFAFCYVKAPATSTVIIKRNGVIYKTLRPNETTFINPFTDVIEISKSSATAFNSPNYVTSYGSSSRNAGVRIYNRNFKLIIPVISLDNKTYVVYTKGSYVTSKQVSEVEVNDSIKRIVRSCLEQVPFSTSPIEKNKNELNILDALRAGLKPRGIDLNSFELSLTEFDNFEKVDCVHYDNAMPTRRKKAVSENFDYYETNKGAITNFTFDISDNPIKESHSITSAIHNTLENMESNVDPIDNKY